MKLTKKILKEMIEEEVLKKKIMSERMDLRESAAGGAVSGWKMAWKWIWRTWAGGNLHGIRHLFPGRKYDLKNPSVQIAIQKSLKRVGNRYKLEFQEGEKKKVLMLEDFVHEFIKGLCITEAGAVKIDLASPPGFRPSAGVRNREYFYSYFSKISKGAIDDWKHKVVNLGKIQLIALYNLVVNKFNLQLTKDRQLIRNKLVVGIQDFYRDSVNSIWQWIDRFSGVAMPAGDFISWFLEKTMQAKASREKKNWIILCSAGKKQVEAATIALQQYAEKISLSGPAAKTPRPAGGGVLRARIATLRKVYKKYGFDENTPFKNIIWNLWATGRYDIDTATLKVTKNQATTATQRAKERRNRSKSVPFFKAVKALPEQRLVKILENAIKANKK